MASASRSAPATVISTAAATECSGSSQGAWRGSIELTQDLPTLRTHWGIQPEHFAERKTEYRYDEIKRESEGMGWTVFVEQELGTHWRMQVEATDLFGRGGQRDAGEVRWAALD